jgi:ATP-dependent exoDNAse (exonuclease V) alpha subunit
LDYACVFLLGLDSPKIGEWSADVAKNLSYVAVTRTREQVYIPYLNETIGLELIRKAL